MSFSKKVEVYGWFVLQAFWYDLGCVQSYMDSEIRAIMAQYMPLDSQNEVHNHTLDDEPWVRAVQ